LASFRRSSTDSSSAITDWLYCTDYRQPIRKCDFRKREFDNKRHRFLTRKEADRLFKALKKTKWERGENTYQISLFALHTGGRPLEIFNLQWGDVDLQNGVCTFKDSKTGDTRHVLMTEAVKTMLSGLDRGKPKDLVFPARGGGAKNEASDLFQRTVDGLGFNDGVEDRRHKVTFYTLRHTFASWHVMAGTDIRVLQRLMGHKNISTTMRYSHVGELALKSAMTEFQRVAVQKKKAARLRKVK
jgi:integrase